MATFKVNYAGLRKTQTKNDSSKNFSEPPTTNAQSTASQPTLGQRTSSKANAAAQKDDAGFLSPYQGSFNSGNMEYINLLLKNKSSSTNKEKSPPKKKGRGRTKSNIADSAPKQSPIRLQSNSPESNRQLVAVPMNSVEENDKPSSMKPDDDDGVHIVRESIKKKAVKQRPEPHKDEFYEGDDTQRNINIAISPPQYENKMIFERFVVGEGGNRRSMSVEDIRIEKQAMAMNHNHNKSTLHDPTGSYFERSPERTGHHDSKQSNPSTKGDFMASLDGYIDYFHKSENMSYRNMKAGQYLRGNNGKSHRLIQKDLDAAMHELNIRNIHIQELKKTINDVLGENKVLKKELKAIHIREQEQHQLIQKMQTEIMHLHQKSHQYKSRCMQTEELLRQERSENENNLFSLKQVLANINVALEQRTSPFRNVTREKRQQTKGTLVDNLFMKKNRENLPKHYTTATKENTRGLERYASIYETVNHRGSTEHKGKRESSMLMSQKDSLLSSEEQSDSLTSNQFTDSNKYGITEETDDFQYQQHYQDSYRQSIAKNHQIRLLQEKLTELMRDDEDHYSSHTPHGKTGGIKTSRAKNPQHRRNMSDLGVANFYMSRERQGSTGKHASLLSRHSPKEQRSRVMHNEYEGNTSMNGTERSFSVHESQEITE